MTGPQAESQPLEIPAADRALLTARREQILSAGVHRIILEYQGSGDEGQIEAVLFLDAEDNPVDGGLCDETTQEILTVLEDVAPQGYGNGMGGTGTVTWTLDSNKITLEHGWYVEDIEYQPVATAEL